MTDIAPISTATGGQQASALPLIYSPSAGRATQGANTGERPAGREAEGRPSDRVDISQRARLLSKLAALPPIRQDLVDRIRDQIAAGEYDTPDRFDAALQQLLEELE